MKREDDIMAGYLLKGGKMLSKSCPSCGCPLFEIKGETLCVVCREEETSRKKTSRAVTQETRSSRKTCERRPIVPCARTLTGRGPRGIMPPHEGRAGPRAGTGPRKRGQIRGRSTAASPLAVFFSYKVGDPFRFLLPDTLDSCKFFCACIRDCLDSPEVCE